MVDIRKKMARLKFYLASCPDKTHGYVEDIDELVEHIDDYERRQAIEIESLRKKIKELREQVANLKESNRALQGTCIRPSWIRVEDSLPEDGVHVFVRRRNKFCERAELSSLYFDGLPAWYLPAQRPVLVLGGGIPAQRDVTHWMYIPGI